MKQRSGLGIVLTVVGVVVVVIGLYPNALIENPKPGFGPWQTVAVLVGVVLMLVGGLLCAKCAKCCKAAPPAQAPAPEPSEGAESEEEAEE